MKVLGLGSCVRCEECWKKTVPALDVIDLELLADELEDEIESYRSLVYKVNNGEVKREILRLEAWGNAFEVLTNDFICTVRWHGAVRHEQMRRQRKEIAA